MKEVKAGVEFGFAYMERPPRLLNISYMYKHMRTIKSVLLRTRSVCRCMCMYVCLNVYVCVYVYVYVYV